MKKLLLSVLSYFMFVTLSFGQEKETTIIKLTNEYFKKVANGIYDKYKPVKTQIKDTIFLGEAMYRDSTSLVKMSEYDTTAQFKTLKIVHAQSIYRSPLVNKYILDKNLIKFTLDSNFKFKKLLDTLIKNNKNIDKNIKMYNIIHTFKYENNIKQIVYDTAVFIYVPIEFTLFSACTTYKKGVNLIMVASDFRKRLKSEIMREKLLKRDEEELTPESQEKK